MSVAGPVIPPALLMADDAVPGMQVTAEIILGRRSVLEYLVSPVQKTVFEAGHER